MNKIPNPQLDVISPIWDLISPIGDYIPNWEYCLVDVYKDVPKNTETIKSHPEDLFISPYYAIQQYKVFEEQTLELTLVNCGVANFV